jgi:hypothetical protein
VKYLTKKQYKRILSIFLLNIFTIGIILGSFNFEINNSNIIFNENQISSPKSSEFDDSNAKIVCYFENNFDDTHGHSPTSNGMSFTTSAIEGSYSTIIDANTDYVRWSDTTDYTQGTIDFFFNPDTVSLEDNVGYYLYSGGDGIYPTSGIYFLNGIIQGFHYSANYQSTPRVYSTTILEPNHNYHIAYSFGPTGTHLYVNGIEENSTLDTRVMHPGTTKYGIGKTFSLSPTYVSAQGVYDMFRFSNIQRNSFPDVLVLLGDKPEPPILQSISSPDDDGDFLISWTNVNNADTYKLYRSSESFFDITAMSPIYIGSATNFNEYNLEEGIYYYRVVAVNSTGESNLSNMQSVSVVIPSGTDPKNNNFLDFIQKYGIFVLIGFGVVGGVIATSIIRRTKLKTLKDIHKSQNTKSIVGSSIEFKDPPTNGNIGMKICPNCQGKNLLINSFCVFCGLEF